MRMSNKPSVGRVAYPSHFRCAFTVLIVASAFVSTGCSTRIADFTGISSKNIYAKSVDVSKLERAEGIEGKDIRFLGSGANIKDALDEALEKGHGNLMIDCAVYVWEAPFFAGFKVRGTVVDVPYKEDQITDTAAGS